MIEGFYYTYLIIGIIPINASCITLEVSNPVKTFIELLKKIFSVITVGNMSQDKP